MGWGCRNLGPRWLNELYIPRGWTTLVYWDPLKVGMPSTGNRNFFQVSDVSTTPTKKTQQHLFEVWLWALWGTQDFLKRRLVGFHPPGFHRSCWKNLCQLTWRLQHTYFPGLGIKNGLCIVISAMFGGKIVLFLGSLFGIADAKQDLYDNLWICLWIYACIWQVLNVMQYTLVALASPVLSFGNYLSWPYKYSQYISIS